MRYADGGGLIAKECVRQEAVRLAAAELFASGIFAPEAAELLRVIPKFAYELGRARIAGGTTALASRRPSGQRCKLGPALQSLQS